MNFVKNNDYFVGIDSDGTVFDSMTIKHTHSCVPAAIEIFDLSGREEEFKAAEERVNLYSRTRGVNRFPGLYLSFLEIGYSCDGLSDLDAYIKSGRPLSNPQLEEYIAEHPSDFLEKVLSWSYYSDELFAKGCEDIAPFDMAYKCIWEMKAKADIMVVSAASSKGLMTDWTKAGLIDATSFVAGQEFGKKASQLEFAKNKGYDTKKMLMVGDAPGDYEAAKQTGAMFYPIVPKKEEESWKLLCEKYFDMFISDLYTDEIEAMLYNEFCEVLK